MKSIRTDPRKHGAEGDERTRTAELCLATDSAYEGRDEIGFRLAALARKAVS